MRTPLGRIVIAALVVLGTASCAQPVQQADKSAFLQLIGQLPHKGEFFTEAAVDTAAPSMPVLLSLSEDDLAGQDIYPFLALSRGLCDRVGPRRYAVEHFAAIAHPQIQLAWASMLFDKGDASPEIIRYLGAVLRSNNRSKDLAELLGPGFAEFRDRVRKAVGQ